MFSARTQFGTMGDQAAHRAVPRVKFVVPISLIVVVAIVCIVIAVLTAAQRADDVVMVREHRLFETAISEFGTDVLRQLESIATTDTASTHISQDFDSAWVQRRVGGWLPEFFDHDAVMIADGMDRILYSSLAAAGGGATPDARRDIMPVIDMLRGRRNAVSGSRQSGAATADAPASSFASVYIFLGQPAVIAGVLVTGPGRDASKTEVASAPIALSVKYIDDSVLAEIANRLQLRNLRQIAGETAEPGDYIFDLTSHGKTIARYAWTPKRPGAEVFRSVIPFIAVALAGFAMLAALILHYMRRTTAMIASGEKRLRHLALHDPLCGLPNRIYFGEQLEHAIRDVRAGGASAALFYIDLDHFKDVNDTLGHSVGDELLRNVTLRLTQSLRSDDVVARLGGDEFGFITRFSGGATPQAIAERLIGVLCAPYTIGNHTLVIGASIGIATIDASAAGAADMMRFADMALYRAKNEGRNRACAYDAAMDADLVLRKQLEQDLREAIGANGLQVAYQPIVNASGGKITAVEALCRWEHPARGSILPGEFIPIAEQSGLIVDLGEWVLRRACLDGKAWPGLCVAVNVSPLQFRQIDFVETVERILAETGFDPARLELELTESTLLGNVDIAENAMQRLRKLGIRLALDDFGTGYSSLQYLRRFPFDKLKIDRSFILSIENADAAAIVHAVVSLGRGLGMKVTAEGVETAEQQLFLRAAGVHAMQGFRFGQPQPAADIGARLTSPLTLGFDGDLAALAG